MQKLIKLSLIVITASLAGCDQIQQRLPEIHGKFRHGEVLTDRRAREECTDPGRSLNCGHGGPAPGGFLLGSRARGRQRRGTPG